MKTGQEVSAGRAVVKTTPCGNEKFITILPGPKQPDLTEAVGPLLAQLSKQGQRVVSQQNFVGMQFDRRTHAEMTDRLGQADWPVTYVQAEAPSKPVFQAIQLHCVPDNQVQRLQGPDGTTIGCIWQDNHNRYCKLGGRLVDPTGKDRRAQSDAVFLAAEEALAQADMDFNDVVRTWFFNDRILDWYGDFNKSRTEYFESRKVFQGIVPASTGIGAFNAYGDALSLQLIAAKSLRGQDKNYQPVDSPLQQSAMNYGSSFSRAAELAGTGFRRLLVSGTASIARGGETLHVGDLDKQVHLTLDVVQAIVESRDMSWEQTSRGIAYVARQEDVAETRRIMEERGLGQLPIVYLVATVCRHDLLYELELDAVASN
jgi:enamine deaminase RidA (YjgF/YER057c/UK114 family)